MLLSIIVVNYNSGISLERTFRALKYLLLPPQVELIVIDGGSSDKSLSVIDTYRDFISKYVSEPDKGIYDAMNKGIGLSVGKWIWFINAGDVPLIDAVACIELLNAAETKDCNYIYSDVRIGGFNFNQKISLNYLMRKMINHQSSIYRRYLLDGGYDISYRYCADYAHLLAAWNKVKAHKSNFILCEYDVSGVSSLITRKRRMSIWLERFKAQMNSSLPASVRMVFMCFSLIVVFVKFINPSVGSIRNKIN